jgi:hypothetical protein
MKFILLFVALNQPPAQLGTYNTEQICNNAIRTIYTTRAITPAVDYSQLQLGIINRTIDTQLQFQQEYVCVSKK